jgi:simple sugar transport system permease protein
MGGLRAWGKQSAAAVFTVALALLAGALLIVLSGNNPVSAYSALLRGAFGSRQRISETLVKFIPLTMMALGVSIAFKGQLWNIGGDGQFIFGGIFAILPAFFLRIPAPLLIPITLLCGIAGGAFWAGIAGWIRVKFDGNEVITTLMLNYIAGYFLSFLVNGPMMDPEGFKFPQSRLLPQALRLPLFVPNMRLHAGIFIMFGVVLLMILFWHTSSGFQIDMLGQGKTISRYAGINVNRTTLGAMLLSGGLIGLAGWSEVYGVQYRLLEGIASGYGNLAVVIALLGNLSPPGICVSSFFFSALLTGGATIQRMTTVPYSIIDIIQGLVIIFVITRTALRHIRTGRTTRGLGKHAA